MPHAMAADGTPVAFDLRGTGPPLVLLSGQANNRHWWDRVRGDFDDSYTTIAVDFRGTGESGKPNIPYSTRGFADDVRAVLDELRVECAHVYGTSMGGRVAQWLAIDHPDRVGALVLGCTSPGGPRSVERDQSVRRALAVDQPAAALLDLMYTPAWLAANPGPVTTLGDPAMPPFARARHLAASSQHDAWDSLPQITAPTLVIHGTDDRLSPVENAHLLVERIPNATLLLIPGARHAYFEECREVAGPRVLSFLAEAGSAR
ncbi:alpha/beta fold hydrolase [Micromonospora sp. CP22]|uniref:alpha/beta fold hydrolase n=1 Tax=Micromonospora sp. CP22 TaxID=2580517 RepID=UPI0018AD1C10|nr:alpha/beta fold hydrolase [Micromonospora sp. CP22]